MVDIQRMITDDQTGVIPYPSSDNDGRSHLLSTSGECHIMSIHKYGISMASNPKPKIPNSPSSKNKNGFQKYYAQNSKAHAIVTHDNARHVASDNSK